MLTKVGEKKKIYVFILLLLNAACSAFYVSYYDKLIIAVLCPKSSLGAFCDDKFSNSGYEFVIDGLRKNWINKIVQLQVRTAN